MSHAPAETATLDQGTEQTVEPRAWWVEIAHHPDPTHIGRRVRLLENEPLMLGRKGDGLGPTALDDAHISRDHARIEFGSQGSPVLFDAGSHNGSFVNGTKAGEHPLIAGDVIGVGSLLLLVEREPAPVVVERPEGIAGTSHAFCSALASLDKAASRTASVLLLGPTGTGKDTFAKILHERTRADLPWVAIRCGAMARGTAQQRVSEALAEAHGGTLYLDGIEDLPELAQLCLLETLDATTPAAARLVASCTSPTSGLVAAGRLRPEFATRIQRWTIRLPALRERRTDIPLLAKEFAQRFHEDGAPGFTPEFMFRLLRHRWPGNIRELEAIVERAAVETDAGPIDTFEALDALLAEPHSSQAISTLGGARSSEAFVVQSAGAWYTAPDGTRHDLGRRKTLARLLAALIERRRAAPGEALGVDALLARAWPEEKLLRRAGANRVYVAVTTLRKMGLRELIARTEAGYLLDPDIALRIIDE